MISEREKIHLITQISLDINEVKDVDLLLERILTNVRKFFDADAGSIYLKDGEYPIYYYAHESRPPSVRRVAEHFGAWLEHCLDPFPADEEE